MNHCMIDLETLSTENDAAVIAIGAVGFNADSIFCEFECLLDPIASPGHRSASTLEWWSKQDPAVRKRMFSGKEIGIVAYNRFCEWAGVNKLSILWGNDPQFDVTILRTLGKQYPNPLAFPFHFRSERSFRTWTWLAKLRGISYDAAYEGITAHDALSDAKAQARAVQLIAKKLDIKL